MGVWLASGERGLAVGWPSTGCPGVPKCCQNGKKAVQNPIEVIKIIEPVSPLSREDVVFKKKANPFQEVDIISDFRSV